MSIKAERETDILRACLELLKLKGVWAWRNNTTGIYDPSTKRFRSFQGLKGVSDILGLTPDGTGRLLAIEAKTATGRVSADQKAFLDRVRAGGGVSAVVRSVAELQRLLAAEFGM